MSKTILLLILLVSSGCITHRKDFELVCPPFNATHRCYSRPVPATEEK